MSSFLGVETCKIADLKVDSIAVLGALNATPYEIGKKSHSEDAPSAVRSISRKFANWQNHYDFDTGTELLAANALDVRDVGDIVGDPNCPSGNRDSISAAVRSILDLRTIPIILGGDDSVPIPALQGFEDHGPVWIVQIDAHIDWRQERFGEPLGWSSTMRRASEMAWVEGIIQLGARGVGSALRSDLEDATRWGAEVVTARQIYQHGIPAALAALPQDARVFIALDCDAFDPSVFPAVMAQVPGGLNYWHMVEILEVISSRARIAGCSIVEFAPQKDIGNVSAIMVARILSCMIAAIDRSRSTN